MLKPDSRDSDNEEDTVNLLKQNHLESDIARAMDKFVLKNEEGNTIATVLSNASVKYNVQPEDMQDKTIVIFYIIKVNEVTRTIASSWAKELWHYKDTNTTPTYFEDIRDGTTQRQRDPNKETKDVDLSKENPDDEQDTKTLYDDEENKSEKENLVSTKEEMMQVN